MDMMNTSTSPLGDACRSEYASLDSSITDWSRPIAKCRAGDYCDTPANNTVYNKHALTDDMWIELPVFAKQFDVSGVYQIHPSDNCSGMPVCAIRHRNIWLRIPIQLMDLSSGYKIYRVEFKHRTTLEMMSLYFSYTIQDDQPCKPYVYMK